MSNEPHPGMTRLPGGAFVMGSNDFYADERPARSTRVGAFWIDPYPVTNRDFAAFVAATGYVTRAERPADADAPGSLVFMPPDAPVDLRGPASWWQWMPGADWRHPAGRATDIDRLGGHPVVHIALEDAAAYAAWAGKRLPNEAEWEFAARGGGSDTAYAWGDDFMPGGQMMAKTWQGAFPWHNAAPVGLERTSPVGSYPANAQGLFDMIGNVWEWTSDRYQPGTAGETLPACCGGSRPSTAALMVLKGGSHLCAPEYCQRYRPAARWPQPADTSTSHVGFRCAADD